MRGLNYWEKKGLLKLSFDSSHTLADISLLDMVPAPKHAETAAAASSLPKASVPALKKNDISLLANDDAFQELLFLAQKYWGKLLKSAEADILGYWYQMFDCSYDIVEYLIEYCVEQKKTSMKYFESVAMAWHEQGLRSLAEIREFSAFRTKAVYSIMKAFGIHDRAPGTKEINYIKRWTQELNFPLELILSACEKTLSATHQPSFEYTESILTAWKKAEVKTLANVEQIDMEHRRKALKKTGEPAAKHSSSKNVNSFHNFEQRNTNYDELIANYYGYHQ